MEAVLEQLISQVRALPPEQQEQLRVLLEQSELQVRPDIRIYGPTPETRWLQAHGCDYIGQWVALDGDRLLAHGKDHREVLEAARAAGVELPLIELVEDPDQPFMGGWL